MTRTKVCGEFINCFISPMLLQDSYPRDGIVLKPAKMSRTISGNNDRCNLVVLMPESQAIAILMHPRDAAYLRISMHKFLTS